MKLMPYSRKIPRAKSRNKYHHLFLATSMSIRSRCGATIFCYISISSFNPTKYVTHIWTVWTNWEETIQNFPVAISDVINLYFVHNYDLKAWLGCCVVLGWVLRMNTELSTSISIFCLNILDIAALGWKYVMYFYKQKYTN